MFIKGDETTLTQDLKKTIASLLKLGEGDIKLLYNGAPMTDSSKLSSYGITHEKYDVFKPFVVELCLKVGGNFDTPNIKPYSDPEEVPECLRVEEKATA